MSGFDNEVVVSIGERLEPSTAQAIGLMQKAATDVSRINHTGNPEGVVAANPSSLSHDPVTGNVYIKQTGTGNTGWVQNASLISGLAGTVLQGQGLGVAPAYSTATYPSTATGTGTILRANGTNWAASTATYPNTVAAGDLLYASATNVLSNLATAADGKHLTIVSGLPTWSTPTFPNTAPAAGTFLRGNGTNWAVSTTTIPNTMTNHGLLVGGASNAVSQLGVGATNTVLTGVTGADPVFSGTPTVTSIAFTTDSQALSRYKTGTYTPAIGGQTGNPTVGYSQQLGFYTILGDRIWVDILITLTSISGGSGNLLISLPFGVASGYQAVGCLYIDNATYVGQVSIRAPSASGFAQIVVSISAGASSIMQVSALSSTFSMSASICYRF